MKKTLSLVIVMIMLLLVSCGGGSSSHTCIDDTGDGRCDICDTVLESACTVHIDMNGDSRCDNCNATMTAVCKEHEDADGDYVCDACGADMTVVCTAHTDSDKNGVCDTCSISVVIILDFYAMNDTHGKFANSSEFTGVDELTTYFKNAYETDDNAIILSSGDMWQGAAESNLTKGYIFTDWMNELGFVSMTLGNHEFDWGSEYIELNAAIAEFPLLAINVYDRETNTPASYCEPSVIVERDGIKIGIIGAIGDCYSSISASKVSDVYFKTGSELTALVKAESERLRAEGAELIVYSLHDGYGSSSSSVKDISSLEMMSYYDTALSDGYVDLVFEAHTHQSYIHRDRYGVYHLQTGGDDSGVAHVELSLNFVTDEYVISVTDIVESSEYEHLEDDPIVDVLLNKYESELAVADKLLGTNLSYRSSDYIKQTVADLYYQYGMEKWGGKYDIVLGGGYISARAPYNIEIGKVYYRDLISILPFDNEIVLCSISGENLKNRFFETSNGNYYISYGEYGSSVKNSIDTSATYYVVVDSYSLDYASNGLTYIDTLDANKYARDLLAEYIEEGGFGLGADAGDEPSYTLTPIKTVLDELDDILDASGYNISTPSYYIKGTIESFDDNSNAQVYGNCTIVDENGDRIYVYGIYGMSGEKYNAIETKPVVGDTVVLYGVAKYYQYNSTSTPQKELFKPTLIEIVDSE